MDHLEAYSVLGCTTILSMKTRLKKPKAPTGCLILPLLGLCLYNILLLYKFPFVMEKKTHPLIYKC